MRPLRVDFWGFWPRQLLAGLAILLAAAVLSLVLFPAGHGSFVSTHGPATAFRSRRLFLAIRVSLAAFADTLAGLFCPAPSPLRRVAYGRWHVPLHGLPVISPFSAVLLC